MKKSILRFGALALMSMMSIGVFAFEAVGNKGTYTDNGDGTATLKKAFAGNTVVDKEVQNSDGKKFKVIGIESKAFEGKVNSVTSIAETVKSVADEAFKGVTSLTINLSQLESIGKNAFNGVKTFNAVGIAGSPIVLKATTIGEGAFAGTNLVAVQWGTISTIPVGCFKDCKSLNTFVFGKIQEGVDYVTTIGQSAFENCSSLVSFGWLNTANSEYCLPMTLTTIEPFAFRGCEALTGLKYSNLVVPNIKEVKLCAFDGCKSLNDTDFSIFKNATTIESGAFKGCTSLKNVTIPAEVQEFTAKSEVVNKVTYWHGVFEGCTSLSTVSFNKSFRGLVLASFRGCTALQTLTGFDKTAVTEIPESAFEGTTALTGISLPNITKIGKLAFKNTGLTAITFPASVTEIGEQAFIGSTSIESITIMGKNANGAEFKLADKVTCAGGPVYSKEGTITDNTADYAFDANIYSTATLNVPYGCRDLYAAEKNRDKNPTWRNFDNVVNATAGYKAPAEDQTMGERFWVGGLCYEVITNDGSGIATVKVVDGLYVNGTDKDSDSKNPAEKAKAEEINAKWKGQACIVPADGLTIPQYVSTRYDGALKNNAFYKVVKLDNVNTAALKDGNNKPTAVANVIAAIKTVTISAANIAVPNIFNNPASGGHGFGGLETFQTAGEGSISSFSTTHTFQDCKNLTAVNIKTTKEFTELKESTFLGCNKLESFNIPATVTSIGDYAFEHTILNTVNLPSGIKSIGRQAFNDTKLTSINIPASVTKIGVHAFVYTYDLDREQGTGVMDVYTNWETADFGNLTFGDEGINSRAFGDPQEDTWGRTIFYHLRNLHYPAGMSDYYEGKAVTSPYIFSPSAHLFRAVEGIKVNGKNVYMTRSTEEDEYPSITLYDKVDGKGVDKLEIKNDIAANITYNRTFPANVWQCWYVPFEVKAGMVEGATFAKLYDTKVDGDNITIELKEVASNEKVKANTCYVVKFAEAGEKNIEASSYKLFKTVENGFNVSCATTVFDFMGLYAKRSVGAKEKPYFYIVNERGNFEYLGSGNNVYAYRFIMTPSKNESNPYNVKFIELDDETTAIEDVKANSLNAPMFDLMGRQITAPAKGQVYIQNGVKKLAR